MPRASTTTNIGVISRRPFSRTTILVPWYSLVAGKRRSTQLTSRLSSNSSSSLGALLGQLDRRVDQERPEDVEDPAEVVDRRGADGDEAAAHHQGEDDADQQRGLLVARGHLQPAHDDDEHEQVVDRQRVLREPAGEELAAVLGPGEQPHPEPEQRSPARRRTPGASATSRHGRLVRPAADDEDVDDQQGGGDAEGDGPQPGGDVQRCSSGTVLGACTPRLAPEVSSASAHRAVTSGPDLSGRDDDPLRGVLPSSRAIIPDGRAGTKHPAAGPNVSRVAAA